MMALYPARWWEIQEMASALSLGWDTTRRTLEDLKEVGAVIRGRILIDHGPKNKPRHVFQITGLGVQASQTAREPPRETKPEPRTFPVRGPVWLED